MAPVPPPKAVVAAPKAVVAATEPNLLELPEEEETEEDEEQNEVDEEEEGEWNGEEEGDEDEDEIAPSEAESGEVSQVQSGEDLSVNPSADEFSGTLAGQEEIPTDQQTYPSYLDESQFANIVHTGDNYVAGAPCPVQLQVQEMDRYADAAFEFIMEFKAIVDTPEVIDDRLLKKCDEAVMMYIKGLGNANKDNPPVNKNQPPTSARVWWVRTLFYSIKKSIVKLRSQEDVISTKVGQQACNEYLQLGKEMRAYEDFWYHQWKEASSKTIGTILQANILMKQPAVDELGPDLEQNQGKMIIRVNLPPELMEMIEEAIHLEQMSYRINDRIRNIALLKENLIAYSGMLQKTLNEYYAIRRRLRSFEREAMKGTIRQLETNFDQGLQFFKWIALGIPDYGARLNSVVQAFDETVTQVNMYCKYVRASLLEIKVLRLFQTSKKGKFTVAGPILDCLDYFEHWDNHRTATFDRLLLLYKGLPPLFMKLENLSYGKSTGKHKMFKGYYAHWEKCVFKYLAKVVIRSLNDFSTRITLSDPLFTIDAILFTPEPVKKGKENLEDTEIRLSTSSSEIFELIAERARDCVEGTQKFIRWRRGTCIEVTPIKQALGEPFVYSYFTDIGRLPRILQLMLQIQENIQTILQNLLLCLQKYRQFRNIWIHNKKNTVAIFAENNPPLKDYIEKMAFYTDISNRLMDLPEFWIEGCIRLNCRPLQTAIGQHAREWIVALGKALQESTKELSETFSHRVSGFEDILYSEPRTKDETNKTLVVLHSVQPSSMSMEVLYRDLLERYAVMRTYKIDYSPEEITGIEKTWQRWQQLSHGSEIKAIKKKLEPMKKRFKI